jgi:dGTPase
MALRLNPDLAECVTLAHDLGHPPFGHVGERALHDRMRDHGGFRHNAQGLRIVDVLEESYPDRPGLNLCWETRVCLLKGKAPDGFPVADDLPAQSIPYLEGQIVDLCDRVAYVSHDMEDALRSGLLKWETFAALALPRRALESLYERYPSLREEGTPGTSRLLRKQTVAATISILWRDIVQATAATVAASESLTGPDDVRRAGRTIAAHSQPMRDELAELLRVLRERFYRHPEVLRATGEAADRMTLLFDALVRSPDRLPERFARRIDEVGLERTVCDYVSGMTDSYVEEMARDLP